MKTHYESGQDKTGSKQRKCSLYNTECFIFYCQTFLTCSVSCNKLAFVLPESNMIPPYTQWACVMQECQVTWSNCCWRVSHLPWRLNIPVVVIKAWQPAYSQAKYSFSHLLCPVCKQKSECLSFIWRVKLLIYSVVLVHLCLDSQYCFFTKLGLDHKDLNWW